MFLQGPRQCGKTTLVQELMEHGHDSQYVTLDDAVTLKAALECFVAGELTRQISWSETRPGLFHYRTYTQQEVDFILEDAPGRLAGIEVKKSASQTSSDFKELRHWVSGRARNSCAASSSTRGRPAWRSGLPCTPCP